MMTTELLPLVILIIMQLVLGMVATAVVGQRQGMGWLLSSRDRAPDYGATSAGRLHRARANSFEALILFAPLALVLGLGNLSTTWSLAAAWVFVGARLAYWLAYALDMVPGRTIIWFIGWFGLWIMAITALIGLI